MRTTLLAAVAAVIVAAPAMAQDMAAPATGQADAAAYPAAPQDPAAATAATTADYSAAPAPAQNDGPTAPDGTPAFGIEPYFGVMGGYEKFDRNDTGIIQRANGNAYEGALVQGVLGANVPLGPVFVGAEGNVIKGVDGAIDWQYGVAGRFGVRAGDSGLIYGKVGYQWVNFAARTPQRGDYGDITYGIGAEVGPKDIGLGGITGNSGVRVRLEMNTFGDFESIRPMAGLVVHF